MTYLEGVYWDLDGTISNTELEAHLPAFNKSFFDLSLDWHWDKSTYIDLLKINGGKNRIAYFAKKKNLNISEDFILKIHKKKQENYLNLLEDGAVSLKTGVYRLISELKLKNVRQFIVTSSSKVQVELLVKNLFKEFNPFEFFITSDDVELLKPNPSPYLKAINKSRINNLNSLVFEDSNPGLISSNAANLPTICVQSNIPVSYDKNIKMKCLINTLGDDLHPSKIIIGPKLINSFIDYYYLINFLDKY